MGTDVPAVVVIRLKGREQEGESGARAREREREGDRKRETERESETERQRWKRGVDFNFWSTDASAWLLWHAAVGVGDGEQGPNTYESATQVRKAGTLIVEEKGGDLMPTSLARLRVCACVHQLSLGSVTHGESGRLNL